MSRKMELFSGGCLVVSHLLVAMFGVLLQFLHAKFEKFGMDPMKRNLIDMVSYLLKNSHLF